MNAPPPSLLLDTTLRDGEQAPGVSLTADEKVAYVQQAESIGIRYLEVGFPHNAFDRQACRSAAAAAKLSRLVAMALTSQESIDAVAETGVHEVLLVVPSSTHHVEWLYRRSMDELLQTLHLCVRYAWAKGL